MPMDNQTRELIENVIAISQIIASIVASLKIWAASSPLDVESGLKIALPSWSRPTISVPDASSQPAMMHATVLVIRDPGNDNLFLSNGSSTIATFGHVRYTSSNIINGSLSCRTREWRRQGIDGLNLQG